MKEPAKTVSTVAIIGGAGNFGSWYARFFKQKGLRVIITARRKAHAEQVAAELGVEWTTDNKRAAAQGDVVIASVPAESAPAAIREIAPAVKPGALLVDFSSVKTAACAALEEFKSSKIELASVHPMHGPRIAALRNVPVAFIPVKPGEKYSWLKRVFSSEGADVVETTCAEHDRAVSIVQGLTHFVCIAAARAIRKLGLTVDRLAAFSTPNHELLEACIARVVLQDPRLYAGLQVENPLNREARAAFAKAVAEVAASADAGDVPALERKISEAAQVFTKRSGEMMLRRSDAAVQEILHARVAERIAETKIAVLGPPGTFSDLAAELYEREKGRRQRLYFRSIPEVFEAVAKGACEEGIAPVENMIEGMIAVTLDSLFTSGLKVKHSVVVLVHHCIAALPGTKLKDVQRVLSHPQALAQCRRWIQRNVPKAKVVEAASTAEAIAAVAYQRVFGDAAIGLEETAELNRLAVLARNIEDDAKNVTKFFVIAKKDSPQTGSDETSIVLQEYEDRPGLLHDILGIFSSRGINLSKIESRPAKKRLGGYLFYVDLEGHREDKLVKEALAKVEKLARVKVLGSYPRPRKG